MPSPLSYEFFNSSTHHQHIHIHIHMNIRVFSWHRRRTRSSNLSFSLHSAIALLSALRLDASKTPALPSRLYWPTVAPDAVAECNRISFSFACGALVVRVLVVCVCLRFSNPQSTIYCSNLRASATASATATATGGRHESIRIESVCVSAPFARALAPRSLDVSSRLDSRLAY